MDEEVFMRAFEREQFVSFLCSLIGVVFCLHGLFKGAIRTLLASLNILSLETALLLLLTSAERVSDQCALFICPSCLLMREDLTDATLKSCPLQPTM